MPIRLINSAISRLTPRANGNFIEYDTETKGFGVRVTPAGAKSFILTYRTRSHRQRRYTIGRHPSWSVSAARKVASELLLRVANGEDPLEDREAKRTAPTMAYLAECYVKEHLPTKRPRSQAEDRSMLNGHILPAMRAVKVADINHAAVQALQRKLTKAGKPIRANAVTRLLSKMFNLAIQWGYRTDNPCKGVTANPEHNRERYLKPDEVERLMKAATDLRDKESANVIVLAMLTGARRGELLTATWDQFDLDAGVWTKPSSHTKQKRTHRVPVSPHALELLKAIRAEASVAETLVFPTRAKLGIRAPWERVRRAASLPDVRFHDLRHSYASLLVGDGVSLHIVGRLLGHTQAQTTMRYAHLADDPLREATNRVGEIVSRAQRRG
jgi:integrase